MTIHKMKATTNILSAGCVPIRWQCLISISEACQYWNGLTDWQADRYLYAIAKNN
jgi:hypothetical protein